MNMIRPVSDLRKMCIRDSHTVDRTFTHKDWKSFSFREADKKFTSESDFIASGALDA